MALVNFKRGTKPADVSSLDPNTIYFFTDTKEIYLGSEPYAGDLSDINDELESLGEDVESLQSWMTTHQSEYSDLDDRVEDLEEEIAKKLVSLTAADGSVIVGGTDTAKTVKVAISETPGNALSLADDGLSVTVPAATDYTVTVTEDGTPVEGYAKTYTIKQEATSLNAKINIPKDLVVSSGAVVKDADSSHSGTWIKLVLNNDDVLWIDVADLVDTVTANNGENPVITVTVTDGTKISATLNAGTVTKAHLVTAVQTTLDHADEVYTALTWGTI